MTDYSITYNRREVWEIDPERLRLAMNRRGITQTDLADRVGVKQPSIGRLLSGETKTSRRLNMIADVLQTSPAYLCGESDDAGNDDGGADVVALEDARVTYRGREPKRSSDTVDLAEYKVSYGMGASYIHDASVEPTMRTFSRSWVRQFTDSPFEALFWATGNGTSMMPAILENDTLLIDTERRTPRMWDEFWAIDMHGMGMIKALRPGKEGAMRLISINPDWPEEIAYDGEMNIVGRVVAIVRKV